MSILTEITVTERDEDGSFQPVRGKALLPYIIRFNELVGFVNYMEIEKAKALNAQIGADVFPVPAQTIPLNIDQEALERGFNIMQQKVVLHGFWGVDHLAEDDLEKFGQEFPDVHLSIVKASTPKANGHLAALRHIVRHDWLGGRNVAQWAAQPIEWQRVL